jgi:uncharacterized membrane protein
MGAHRVQELGRTANPPAGQLILVPIVVAAVATLAAMVWLWPADRSGARQQEELGTVAGTIVAIDCPKPAAGAEGMPQECGATVTVASGRDAGERVEARSPSGPGAQQYTPGDKVKLTVVPGPSGQRIYQISDFQRGRPLLMLAVAFALAVVAFGRWRGLTALAGLAVTFAVLVLFVVPGILAGQQPLLIAIVGSAAIALTVLYLTHGFTLSTSIAVVGTLASLTLTGLLSVAAIDAVHLSGLTDENSFYLRQGYEINLQGLLLAGIVIGSLGVLDDITVTQVAAVNELAAASPTYRFRQLYRAATRVGRAHIASVINTIVLAYAGASLPLLLLITSANQPLSQVVTGQLIAQEIVRAIVGTLGLIAAVPITTALSALLTSVRAETPEAAGVVERHTAHTVLDED